MLGAMSLLHVQCSVYLVFLLDFLFSVSNLCNNVIVLSLNDSYTGNMYYLIYLFSGVPVEREMCQSPGTINHLI